MRFELITLGTSGAVPTPQRFSSSQLLCTENRDFLVDCGEGCQIRLQEYGSGFSRIDHIFISHLHGDHFYGLPGLLTSWALGRRSEPLTIYSPPGLEALLRSWLKFDPPWPFPVRFIALAPEKKTLLFRDAEIEVFAFPLHHGIATNGYLIQESRRPATILPDRIAKYAIPFTDIPAIKAGADYTTPSGTIIPHEELTRPASPPRSYAYCSDTRFLPGLADLVRGVDLLYHEATFLHELRANAQETLHSTAREAAEVALAAEAKELILGHYSFRYSDPGVLEKEAREVFPHTTAARDGDRFPVAYSGRLLVPPD